MPQEEDLVDYEIYQNIESFTLISHFSDVKLHNRLDIIVCSFAVSMSRIDQIKCWVTKITVSKIHPDLFLSVMLVKEFKFFPNRIMNRSPFLGQSAGVFMCQIVRTSHLSFNNA
jgi:uncharacterized membrane protein